MDKFNKLYQYGIADAFVAGLFRGTLPLSEIKKKGDFGLAAPNLLDGELTVTEGKVYQTRVDGNTKEINDDYKTPLGFVTFFKADISFGIDHYANQSEIFNILESRFGSRNAMYAIRISGEFSRVKARAFPAIEGEPFLSLASLLEKQNFFEHEYTSGTLIGFHLPVYLKGISVEGYHFHFLSDDKTKGGHVLDFTGSNLNVEIAELKGVNIEPPQDEKFREFDYNKVNKTDLEKVEKGR